MEYLNPTNTKMGDSKENHHKKESLFKKGKQVIIYITSCTVRIGVGKNFLAQKCDYS